MKQVKKAKIKLIGRREFVDFPELDLMQVEAKIDTGAYTSSLHCEKIELSYEGAKPVLLFTIETGKKTLRFEKFGRKKIKNSFGEMEERFIIKTIVHIGGKKVLGTISLSNRDNMRYPALIGRRIIKGKFVIDPKLRHTGGISLKKDWRS